MKERRHAIETIPAGAHALLDHQTGELTLDSDRPVGPPEDWSRQQLLESYRRLDSAAQQLLDSVTVRSCSHHPEPFETVTYDQLNALQEARGLRRPRP